MITIRSIVRWERLRGKSFAFFNMREIDDVEALLYTVFGCTGEKRYTFEVFKETLVNKQLVRDMINRLESEFSFDAQFELKAEEGEGDGGSTEVKRIEDIAGMLIVYGIDPSYVMDNMPLYEIPIYIRELGQKKREMLENDRLWTWLSIRPHLTKYVPITTLYRFPWEEEITQDTTERDIEMFNSFINNKS